MKWVEAKVSIGEAVIGGLQRLVIKIIVAVCCIYGAWAFWQKHSATPTLPSPIVQTPASRSPEGERTIEGSVTRPDLKAYAGSVDDDFYAEKHDPAW